MKKGDANEGVPPAMFIRNVLFCRDNDFLNFDGEAAERPYIQQTKNHYIRQALER